MQLDLRHVRAITEIKKHKSFRRAADALNVTPPALTRLIKELEASLGVDVINRETKPVSLTSYGDAIFEQGQTALGALSDSLDIIRTLQGITNNEVVVATSCILAPDIASASAMISVKENPQIHFKVDSFEPEDALYKFNHGMADVLILDKEQKNNIEGPHQIDLYPHPNVAYWFKKGHPLDKKSDVVLLDCLSYPLVGPRPMLWWDQWFANWLELSDLPLPAGYNQTSPFHSLITNEWNCQEEFVIKMDAISGSLAEWLNDSHELFSEVDIVDRPPYPKDMGIFVANRNEPTEAVEHFVDAAKVVIKRLEPLSDR